MILRRKAVSLLLILVLCLGTAVRADASEISETEKEAEELEQKKQAAEEEKNALEEQLNAIVSEMEETKAKIDEKENQISAKEDELIQARVDENDQYESMKKRIKYMYENGNTEFIEILCASKSIGEFLNNAEYITTISEYDRNQLTVFQEIVKEVKRQEEELQSEYTELTSLREKLSSDQASVEQLLENADMKLEDLEKQIGDNAALLEKLKKEAEEAEARRKAAEEAARAQESAGAGTYEPGPPVVSGNTQFTNPCPGASYISSEFGEYRSPSDPAHKGMDFAANTGVPTYAAADGTVLYAFYSDSAGNWVVINHGNGLVTKYMHHSAIYVSAGQYVTKGQQIGAVGSTGWSTGPHLHFQVEVNGMAVNPRNYL